MEYLPSLTTVGLATAASLVTYGSKKAYDWFTGTVNQKRPDDAESLQGRVDKGPPANARVEAARVEALVNNPNPHVEVEVDNRGNAVESDDEEVVFVPKDGEKAPFDSSKLSKYLNTDKATMVFSTAALAGEGVSRSVPLLETNGSGNPAPEREKKGSLHLAEVKHSLGLGENPPYPKVPVSYSVTWHFIEVFDNVGEEPSRYDLTSKTDIERLLEKRGLNHDVVSVDVAFKELLDINKEIKELTKYEVGKTKDPMFVHDYMGNPSGLALFHPASDQGKKVAQKKSIPVKTQERMGHVVTRGSGLFEKKVLTDKGAIAHNYIHNSETLINKLKEHLEAAKAAKKAELEDSPEDKVLKNELEEITKAYQEIEQLEAMPAPVNFVLMEAASNLAIRDVLLGKGDRNKRLEEAGTIAKSHNQMIAENKEGYETTKEEKQRSAEVGVLVQQVALDGNRIDVIQASQKLQRETFTRKNAKGVDETMAVGREVFREPKAAKLVLSGVLHITQSELIDSDWVKGYENSAAKGAILAAFAEYQGQIKDKWNAGDPIP